MVLLELYSVHYSMIFFLLSYVFLVYFFLCNWNKIPNTIPTLSFQAKSRISIVVAAKNEEKQIANLLQSLENQTLEKYLFEIVVIDDFSTDNTFEAVTTFAASSAVAISIVSNDKAGKKNAISKGIAYSKGEIIVCTDADCTANAKWLETIAFFFDKKQAKLAFGLVLIDAEKRHLFHQMQQIEFASLVGSGAASWQAKIPNMCNGANIAYTKSVFYEVKGFEGNEQVASGDDEFLMHKVFEKYPNDVHFLKSASAIINTKPLNSFSDFYKQRKRWASKFEHYGDWKVQAMAFYIFCINFFQIASVFFIPLPFFVALWSFRAVSEYIFLASVLGFMHKRLNLKAYLGLLLIYPCYVVGFAVAGRFNKITK